MASASSKTEDFKTLKRVHLEDKEAMGMNTEQITVAWHSQMKYVVFLEKVAASSTSDEEVQTYLQSIDKDIQQLKGNLKNVKENARSAIDQDPLAVPVESRGSLGEPCANLLIHKLRCNLRERESRVENLTAEIEAWKLTTSDGCTIDEKKAMAKCRLLGMENTELGDQVSDSRMSHIKAQAEEHKAATLMMQQESTAMDCMARELDSDMMTIQGTLMLLYQALRVKGKLSADLVEKLSKRKLASPPLTSTSKSGHGALAGCKKLNNNSLSSASVGASSSFNAASFSSNVSKSVTDSSMSSSNGSSRLGCKVEPSSSTSADCQNGFHSSSLHQQPMDTSAVAALSSKTCSDISARDDTRETLIAATASLESPECEPKSKRTKLNSTSSKEATLKKSAKKSKAAAAVTESKPSISNGIHCSPPGDVESMPSDSLCLETPASLQPTCNNNFEGGENASKSSKESSVSSEMRASNKHRQNLQNVHTTVMNGTVPST